MIDSQCAIGGESQTTRSLQVRNSKLHLGLCVSSLSVDNLKPAIDNYFQVYTHTLSSAFVLFVIMEAQSSL